MSPPIFERKRIDQLSKRVQEVANLMSISRTVRITGAASLDDTMFINDYDLDEMFESPLNNQATLDNLYHMFLTIFDNVYKDDGAWVTDFKCGLDSDGDPLRWSYSDMKKGYKQLPNGTSVSFQSCILRKADMKLDLVVIMDSVFVEFSDIYYIKLGNQANYNLHEITTDHTLSNIEISFDEYMYSMHNYWKALKRSFSYFLLKKQRNKELKLMLGFFNGEIGLINKLKSELEAMHLVLSCKFKPVSMGDIHRNLSLIVERIKDTRGKTALSYLAKAMQTKSTKIADSNIESAINVLYGIVNSASLYFIHNNKSCILY